MGDWYCYHCNRKLETGIVWVHIQDIDRPIHTHRCPSCKAIWASEENVKKLGSIVQKLNRIIEQDIPKLNKLLNESGVPHVVVGERIKPPV